MIKALEKHVYQVILVVLKRETSAESYFSHSRGFFVVVLFVCCLLQCEHDGALSRPVLIQMVDGF